MERTNYALISALYSNSNHGLYSDIYFPIIKYALTFIFSKREESHPYCSADEIHNFIVDKFGIAIPHIVISKSILKIDAQRWGNIKLNVYENGDTFQIQSASYDSDEESINERERAFSDKISILESKYKEFLEREGSTDDGISFIQFISDNTDDILGYFEEQDTSKVDERYATMVFFLQYLNDYEKDLYQVANQLFWGSVIAGFLKSDKPHVEETEDGIKAEYFLDTSIVMGVLKLSTPQRETYSQEVCDIINAAGGILRVSPMTIDEISYILQSVEQNGPNPLTDIASACERRKLEANELAQIRLTLPTEVEKNGINVFPQMSPSEKQKIIQNYQGKKVIRLLGESRTKRPTSYSSDNYREIHDVFMDNYIKERRAKKGNDNHVFFLTANRDLIAFCKTMHPTVDYMKSTGKVILELWMHNTKPVDISGCLLTETMARCLDLHSTRVRNKIAEVSDKCLYQKVQRVDKWYLGKWRIEWMSRTSLSDDEGVNFPIIRYADVVLMFCEAALGGITGNVPNNTTGLDVQTQFDKIRARAGVPSKPLNMSNLMEERKLEFAGEYLRKYDLIRWGKLRSAMEDARVRLQNLSAHSGEFADIPETVYYKFRENYDYTVDGSKCYVLDAFLFEQPADYYDDKGWQKTNIFESDAQKVLDESSYFLYDYSHPENLDSHQLWPIFTNDMQYDENGYLWNDYDY